MFKKTIFASLAMIMLFALSGCNTFKGVGKDVQSGGEAITSGATRVSDSF